MRRRLNAADFERAQVSMKGRLEYSTWWACDEYEVEGEEIVAKWPEDELSRWWGYRPLEDTPSLFLYLAELGGASNFQAAALDFCHNFGIPGEPVSVPWHVDRVERINMAGFREETKKIAKVVEIYERALNGDQEVNQEFAGRSLPGGAGSPLMYREHGLGWAVALVTERVQSLCRPTLYFTLLGANIRPEAIASKIESTWEFDNLLGAAYLQMWWLLASGGDVTRCENCRRVISLARPRLSGRKTRRDKRFCSDSCRQAHHRSRKKS